MEFDLDTARAAFDASTDFTVGLEEEFALVDPVGLGLVQRFEELRDAAASDLVLAASIAGELISSDCRPARSPPPAIRDLDTARHRTRRHGDASLLGLSRAADHRHRALPKG